jgi:hypothetical protein
VVRCYDRYDHAYEYFPLMYVNVEGLSCVYVHENGHEDADVNVWYLHESVHDHAHECARDREGKYVCDLDSLYPPLQVNPVALCLNEKSFIPSPCDEGEFSFSHYFLKILKVE